MNNIKGFNDFILERNDIGFASTVNDYYTEIFQLLTHGKYESKFIPNFLDNEYDSLVCILPSFRFPLIIAFVYKYGDMGLGNTFNVNGIETPSLIIGVNNCVGMYDILKYIHEYQIPMKHEITHLIDSIKHPNSTENGSSSLINLNKLIEYYNHVAERNAYYMQNAAHVIKLVSTGKKDVISSWDNFMKTMKDYSQNGMDFLTHLTEKNKKKYLSRCYLLYKELRRLFKLD